MGVDTLTVGIATVVGLVCGAFVPLVAYRLSVPAGQPARDACARCGLTLPGVRASSGGLALPGGLGLVGILAGWIRLPARCSGCAARLGPPWWLTALIAAVASGLVAAAVGPTLALPLFVAASVLGVLLGFIDAACKRLPHALVLPAIWVTALLLTVIAAVTGEWGSLLRAALGAAALGTLYLAMFLFPGQGIGLGDVKLAVALGGLLGWIGWREVLLGALLPWLLNGPIALALLLAGRVSRKTTLPFGPAMLAGALLSLVVGAWLGPA